MFDSGLSALLSLFSSPLVLALFTGFLLLLIVIPGLRMPRVARVKPAEALRYE